MKARKNRLQELGNGWAVANGFLNNKHPAGGIRFPIVITVIVITVIAVIETLR